MADQLTVTPDKTATYQLLVRFGDEAIEREVTVEVTKDTVLRQAQVCLYIRNSDGRCVEPPRRDDEGDGKCFYADPYDGTKRDWESVIVLLRFRDLPIGRHRLKTAVWKGNNYPANNHAGSESFNFQNQAENYHYDFSVRTDGKTKYWRIGLFLDNHWVGEVEFRVCG